jgi:transmembrane sensor
MSEPGRDRPQGQLFEEAAGWFARMRGPDAEASRGEFEAWLARGALHRSAYNRAAEIFAMGKLLKDQDIDETRPAERRTRKSMLAAGAVVAACLVAGVGWIGLRQAVEVRSRNEPVAEQRRDGARPLELTSQTRAGAAYRLNDGSVVTLAAATQVRVDFTPQARRLVLQSGAGRFKVAHELRPFIVYAGGGSVTARGTVFDVALTSDRRVRVHLVEGVIEVAVSGPAPQRRLQRLVAGQSTSFEAQDPQSSTAQQSGSLASSAHAAATVSEFDGVRLSDLIDAANRNSQRPIRISGTIGERRISGRFHIDDPELLANRIAALFDLVVDRSNPSVILLKPR